MNGRVAVGLILGALLFGAVSARAGQKEAPVVTLGGPARVVDGDSLRFGGTEVRLLCLDAVELHQDCLDAKGQSYPCGVKAKEAMVSLIGGRDVVCRSTKEDIYGRPLVRCVAGGKDLSEGMIEAGWAISICRATKATQARARAAHLGLWQGSFEIPKDWRRAHPYHKKEEGLTPAAPHPAQGKQDAAGSAAPEEAHSFEKWLKCLTTPHVNACRFW